MAFCFGPLACSSKVSGLHNSPLFAPGSGSFRAGQGRCDQT